MADNHRPGAVYWLDHYVVPTNDLPRHLEWVKNVLGGHDQKMLRLTTQSRIRHAPVSAFSTIGHYHPCGSFLADRMLPDPEPLGKGAPRYGYYVRRADLDEHLARLDRFDTPHTDPIEISNEGEEGTVVYFMDPDGTQYEFWAPKHLPPGAMEADNPVRIGRISHAVLEARDLDRTADFYSTYCALDRIHTADIDKDTLVLRLEGGGRLIFKRADPLGERTGGHNKWNGQHVALTVRNDEFVYAYDRLWEELPESEVKRYSGGPVPDETDFPPRTEAHGPTALGEHGGPSTRGTTFYDWDQNCFHFGGGVPQDGSMAHYAHGYSDFNLPDPAAIQAARARKP